MTKIAIWCRHENDNIIGIGPNIPWHIPSDFKRFRRITEKASITCGQTTYESFPNRTLPNRKIYVLSFDEKYEVSDKDNHFVINNPTKLRDLVSLYIFAVGLVFIRCLCKMMRLRLLSIVVIKASLILS